MNIEDYLWSVCVSVLRIYYTAHHHHNNNHHHHNHHQYDDHIVVDCDNKILKKNCGFNVSC